MAVTALKILAIDDTPDNLVALKAAVRDVLPEAAVVTALDGPQGIALARAVDLDQLLGEQTELLRRTLPETIAVSFVRERGDHTVLADPTRIQQMLMNLAVNARDAMPAGGLLRLALARQETPPRPDLPGGAWISLEVADTGTGIAPEAQAHLFEPFFTTKPEGQGTGLGLAQVHGIVKQHAGEIAVSSTPGEGATFTIYLPAVAAIAPALPAQRMAAQRGHGETILLVEDNALLLEAMQDLLDSLGYVVVAATNGAEALALLLEGTTAIDLVLSDLVMPEMRGDALLAAICASGMTVPVVILSGYPLDGEIAALKAQGLTGWLLKPPHVPHLAQMLAGALGH
jgi:two-component system, cell cycle sensor histidine kinase and response regulator CckA